MEEYKYLIGLMLLERQNVDGFYSDITITIRDKELRKNMFELLYHMLYSTVLIEGVAEDYVIDSFTMDRQNGITIINSSTEKLLLYKKQLDKQQKIKNKI